MSYVNQFLNMVFSMERPVAPEDTPEEIRKRRRLARERRIARGWRSDYCAGILEIINDPAHHKTTE